MTPSLPAFGPEFSEYVIVTEGSVTLLVGEEGDAPQKLSVSAGQGAFLPRGTRVKWVWNGPCSYVPICTPAFSPANCGREEEAGNHLAKSSEAMKELRALHEKANVNADAAPSLLFSDCEDSPPRLTTSDRSLLFCFSTKSVVSSQ